MNYAFDFDQKMKPEPVVLRKYQNDAVSSVFKSWGSGFKMPLLVLPTGAGKTISFAEIVRRVLPRRSLVIAHRQELIFQAQDKIERVTGVRPGIEMASSRASASDKIVVSTVQTLARGRQIDGDRFDVVIVDEAHHALCDNEYGKALKSVNARRGLGVTATPYRGDKRALSSLFDDNPFSMSTLDMIDLAKKTGGKEGLCDIRVRTLPIDIDMSGVHVRQGDFVADEVAAALEPLLDSLADIIANEYSDRKMITFCPLRATSRQWTEALVKRGLAAEHVQGDSPDRAAILRRFANNETRFLSNSAVLIEGYDEPSIDTVLMLRPTKSRGLFAQCIGRGTRLFPGKPHCLVLDPLFTCERHNVLKASSLVAGDDNQERRITELMERGKSLDEATSEAASEAKNKLAEALTSSSKRSAYEKRMAELAVVLDYAELESYEPTMGWHSDKPSDAQLSLLANAGVDTSLVTCKGLASEIINKVQYRRDNGLATIKQVRYARRLGHKSPEAMTFEAAKEWIDNNQKKRAA